MLLWRCYLPKQLALLVQFCFLLGTGLAQYFDLTILHTNDIHARYEQTDAYGGVCSQDLADDGMCFGGYARRVTKIKEARQLHDNVLLLEPGERFYGVPAWHETYKSLAASHFMNSIGYNATGLGSYDFTKGIEGILPFLNSIAFPVVLSNVDSSQEPMMQGLYVTDHVFTFPNGERVGIVGYIWELAPTYKDTGDLLIEEIIPSVQTAVDRLIGRGINKIIALGHSDIDDGMLVARMVRGVDVVVTGANHTLLWNGEQPSVEAIHGPYPMVITPDNEPDGVVLLVTTYRFGKYLGYLNVSFSDDGTVQTFSGNPIILDQSVPQDPKALAEITEWKIAVSNLENEIVGDSVVSIYGLIDRCGGGECNMGNLIADSMVWEWTKENRTLDDGWADVTMAMVNVASFYALQDTGPISFGDIKEWLPWGDSLDLMTLKGRNIVKALEHSVSRLVPGQNNWIFLHVSGMRIVYDMTKPIGRRVQDVQVLCRECDIPEYVPLQRSKDYKIVINSYVAAGGDGDINLRDTIEDRVKGPLDTDVVRDYVAATSPITNGLDGRIVVYDSQNLPPCPLPIRNDDKLRKQP